MWIQCSANLSVVKIINVIVMLTLVMQNFCCEYLLPTFEWQKKAAHSQEPIYSKNDGSFCGKWGKEGLRMGTEPHQVINPSLNSLSLLLLPPKTLGPWQEIDEKEHSTQNATSPNKHLILPCTFDDMLSHQTWVNSLQFSGAPKRIGKGYQKRYCFEPSLFVLTKGRKRHHFCDLNLTSQDKFQWQKIVE